MNFFLMLSGILLLLVFVTDDKDDRIDTLVAGGATLLLWGFLVYWGAR